MGLGDPFLHSVSRELDNCHGRVPRSFLPPLSPLRVSTNAFSDSPALSFLIRHWGYAKSVCGVSLGILLAKYGYELGRKKSVYLGKRLVADLEN